MMEHTVFVIQHIDCERPGLIGERIDAAGFRLHTIRAHRGDPLPETIGAHAGLVVMGGPMSVWEVDRCRFLTAELRLIESALREQRPILGVCLGSQLLAHTLGAAVAPGPVKELGWRPVHLTREGLSDPLLRHLADGTEVVHWHGDCYPLPAGATRLAYSDQTDVQAFCYGSRAYGLLCHLEPTRSMLHDWQAAFAEEARAAGYDIAELLLDEDPRLAQLQPMAERVFDEWVSLLSEAEYK